MSAPSSEQRRNRRIAMTSAELDAFLATEHTCRLATVTSDGPHVTPLWFVWDSSALWLYSLTRSQRWADIAADRRVAAIVDAGTTYEVLRGVELRGSAQAVGDVPRGQDDVPELRHPERLFAQKYTGGDTMVHDHRHAWLKLTPHHILSWDFRKR